MLRRMLMGFFMDIGNKLGQAGVDFGENLNGVVKEFVRRLPVQPFQVDGGVKRVTDLGVNMQVGEDVGALTQRFQESGFDQVGKMKDDEDEVTGFSVKLARFAGKFPGVFNISSTFDSRTHDVESSLVARGDFWRVEASSGGPISTSANENPSLFLVQLGPLLFFRDSTLLLHFICPSNICFGMAMKYDRKNGFMECILFALLCGQSIEDGC